jgi:hypothetical protein
LCLCWINGHAVQTYGVVEVWLKMVHEQVEHCVFLLHASFPLHCNVNGWSASRPGLFIGCLASHEFEVCVVFHVCEVIFGFVYPRFFWVCNIRKLRRLSHQEVRSCWRAFLLFFSFSFSSLLSSLLLCIPQTLTVTRFQIFTLFHHVVSFFRFFFSGLLFSPRRNTVFNLASFALPIINSANTIVFHFLHSFSFI